MGAHQLWFGLPSLKKQEQKESTQARPLLLEVLLRETALGERHLPQVAPAQRRRNPFQAAL